MERTLKGKTCSYSELFKNIGRGNRIHVPLAFFSKRMVQTTCTRINQRAGCDPANNRFTTLTTDKPGYITIVQRY